MVISVAGELDLDTAPRLKQKIADVLDQGVNRLVIDLGDVSYLDSSGLGVLLGALRRLRERDGALKLVCHDGRQRRIFEKTRLTEVFEFYTSETDALRCS